MTMKSTEWMVMPERARERPNRVSELPVPVDNLHRWRTSTGSPLRGTLHHGIGKLRQCRLHRAVWERVQCRHRAPEPPACFGDGGRGGGVSSELGDERINGPRRELPLQFSVTLLRQ